eukprot:g3956.t1
MSTQQLRNAFEKGRAVPRLPLRAVSVCAAQHQLLVGTAEGTLLHFGSERGAVDLAERDVVDDVLHEVARHKRFAPDKQAILALVAVPSWNPKDGGLLLALSPSCITAHGLRRMSAVASLPCSRGRTLLAVLEATSLLLAAGTHKGSSSLVATLWNGSHFLEYQTHALPEPPLALAAAGRKGDVVCVAYRREFRLIDVHTGASSAIIDISARVSAQLGAPGAALPAALVVPASPPRRPQDEMLLSDGSTGRFFSVFSGRAHMSRPADERIAWSAAPVALAYSHPFVLAALPKRIEVHNVVTRALVQVVQLAAVTCLAPARDRAAVVFAASQVAVTRVKLRSIHEQVHVCLAAGQFEEALALCELCPDQAGVDAAARATIHEQYAYELWDRGDIHEATRHFGLARTPVLRVLALFPELLLPGAGAGAGAGVVGGPSLVVLPPALAEAARRAIEREEERCSAAPAGGAVGAASRQSAPALRALCVFLRAARQRESHGAAEAAVEADDDGLSAVQRLGLVDTVLLKATVLTLSSPTSRVACDFLLQSNDAGGDAGDTGGGGGEESSDAVGVARPQEVPVAAAGIREGRRPASVSSPMPAAGAVGAIGSGQYCLLDACTAFLHKHSRWDELGCLYLARRRFADMLELYASLASAGDAEQAKWQARSVEALQLLMQELADAARTAGRGEGAGAGAGGGGGGGARSGLGAGATMPREEWDATRDMLLTHSRPLLSSRPRLGLRVFTGGAADGRADLPGGASAGDGHAATGAGASTLFGASSGRRAEVEGGVAGLADSFELLLGRFMHVPAADAESHAIEALGVRGVLDHLTSCTVDDDVSAVEAVKCTRLDLGDTAVEHGHGGGTPSATAAFGVPLVDGRHLAIAFLLQLVNVELEEGVHAAAVGASGGGGDNIAFGAASEAGGPGAHGADRTAACQWTHTELLNLLLDAILTQLRAPGGSSASLRDGATISQSRAADERDVLGVLRRVLLHVLRASHAYSPAELLARLPPGQLLEERATLLGRLGQDEDVLVIYAQQMQEPQLAQQYCAERYVESPGIYLLLLKLLLPHPAQARAVAEQRERARQAWQQKLQEHAQGGGGTPADEAELERLACAAEECSIYEPALQLLERNHDRFDAQQVLQVLDPALPLRKVAPFFAAVLRSKAERRRNRQVVKQLLKVEALQVQVDLIQQQSRVMHSTFCKVLIKVNNDQQCRQMTVAEFCEELDTGEYGEFEFENAALQSSTVATALHALHQQGAFNVRKRDEGLVDGERLHQFEYWLRKRVHGAASRQHAGRGNDMW